MAKPPSCCTCTNLASCIVATVFIIAVIVAAVTVYLIVFRPRDPEISVTGVKLPLFSVTNNSVSFTFSEFASVRNPNRAVFSHYNSKIQLFYFGKRVGFMFIPAGEIRSGRTKHMSASFSVDSLSLAMVASAEAARFQGSGPVIDAGNRVGPAMEIETDLEITGRVRVLRFMTHRVAAKSKCRITIATADGSIAAVRC
ncbi:PREDICTED: uncharacterized protein LOC104806437 [Tarenaya hassleriana]|uniref:uncharacterized protein LOC104806437 n=1 Tax=Tarenaya hassleriana TaxID=28532 RepID=UPI00053C4E2B|nr:PREDICTED: uncharacterized protein LOC104806437 [Tarenaya hassleriana]